MSQQLSNSRIRHLARIMIIAWLLTAVNYFYQCMLRAAPAVMMPELSSAYALSTLEIAAIVGLFHYGYSPFCPLAGATIDRLGPRKVVPIGAAAVGIGALLSPAGTNRLG